MRAVARVGPRIAGAVIGLAGVAFASLAVAGVPAGDGFVVCYPNAPGDTRSAKPVMKRLGEYLTARAGRRFAPIYFNALDEAEAFVGEERPAFGIVSLAVYLRWREGKALTPVAATERRGATTEQFFLVGPAGGPGSLEELLAKGAPVHVWSSLLDDARFAERVVLGADVSLASEPRAGSVTLVSTRHPLRALRRLKQGKPLEGKPVDAVLVDGPTWEGLQQLKSFAGVLRVLATTASLPTPPVVAFGDVPAADRARLAEVLSAMSADPEGKALLQTLQLTGFGAVPQEAFDAALARYGAGE